MIECNDVIKIYTDQNTNTRVAALRGIDLHINKGEIVSIIGPSGSGKSTLVKILAGTENISSGVVKVNNYEVANLTQTELLDYRLKTIGLVHQFPERTLFLSGTVMDNMIFASALFSKDKKENIERSREILEKLDILKLAHRKVSFLSGGEMIRCAIGCMLAKNAPVLICDEPTGQLDSENTLKVKNLLKEISQEFKTTIIVVTHDLRFLKGVDRTCEIYSGRVSALFNSSEDIKFQDRQFPLKFKSQIDSSHSVRIPNQIHNILQLGSDLEFKVFEDSRIEIVHPDGIPPKPVVIEEKKKQKHLTVEPLTDDYFNGKVIDINLNNVSKIYSNKGTDVHALTDISLKFFKGEFAFVLGPSGSGKTTLIKLLTGIEPCTSGELNILDNSLQGLSDNERAKFRRKNIGIVSQQGDLHPFITVTDNLFVKDILSGKTINLNKFPISTIESLFETFQIEHRKDAYPLEVSGGELQRASLAISQYGNPGLVILDEPTANMDSELAANVMELLYSLQGKIHNTLLITTHDINLVRNGTRVVELLDGKVNSNGIAQLHEEDY
ncbi:MAG: ATP-binding cassette domain-containing protein [Candidatus Heimdallarchaeota archaeon]|nr:ATP-binding cassette domain-containing protein [Candidatus Heimdallarchaeota archaeon]